jgi:hypothetical protein
MSFTPAEMATSIQKELPDFQVSFNLISRRPSQIPGLAA